MKLKVESLYNFAFFGGQRDNCHFDGHYAYVTDLKEFVFYKVADYGGFMWVRKNLQTVELTENQYRYVHDAIFKNTRYLIGEDLLMDVEPEFEKYFTEMKRYKLQSDFISANVHRGDTVVDISGKDDKEPFIVDHTHDLNYINRNHHYKILNRDVHPPMKTREEFIAKLNSIILFSDWTLCELPKKGLNNFQGHYIINGKVYKMDSFYPDKGGADTYYITTPGGNTYSKRSSVSRPYYDQIDLLTGEVYCDYENGSPVHYCIHDVVHDLSSAKSLFACGSKHPTKYRHFTEKESYHYNTRLTYL